MLALFVIFSLLTTTCPQPCTNCVPQQRQYQYVVNVPMVPVQGVAVPSNNPQGPCCNGAVPGQQATQLIWYSAGNGQQNSGMLSNFTAISTQGGFNYQNPTGGSPPPGYITPGYSGPSTPIPTQAGQGFTSPPPNYNPNVYLQPTTPPPGFTGQTVGPTGAPIMPGGNQPYPPGAGPQQGPGTYNQANTGYFENEGNFNTGPVINQGGPNPPPNDQGNFYGQGQGGFPQGQQFNPSPGQGGYYPGQQGQQGMQQGGYTGEQFPGQDGGYNQANMGDGQYPPQQGPQYNPQGNPQYGPVGDGGMLVNGQYQGPPQGSGAAGAAIAGGVAGAAAAGAAGFNYATSSMYSTTTPIPPRTNTPGGPTSSPGFPYSTQNPNQPNFDPNQQPQSSVYPVIGSPAPGTSPYANQQGFSTTMNPNFEQGNFGSPSSIPPNQQGNMYTAQGTSYGPGNPPPNYQGNDDQFNQGQFTQGPNNQGQYNQGNIGYMPTGNQQFPTTTFAPSPSGSPFPSSTTPFPQQTQMGPSSTPNNQGFQGSTTPFPPNFGPSSTSGNFQQTGNYPPGAQQDQAPTTLPPNVNVVGGGQAGPTTYQPGMSSSQAGPSFQPTTTTVRPFYDTNNYAPGNMMTGGGFPQNQGGLSSTVYPPNYTPVAGGASGGAGYAPQFDFEHNMNTQYGHYNQSTSDLGPSRDAPQATQPTQSARSTGSLHLVLLAVLSLLFI